MNKKYHSNSNFLRFTAPHIHAGILSIILFILGLLCSSYASSLSRSMGEGDLVSILFARLQSTCDSLSSIFFTLALLLFNSSILLYKFLSDTAHIAFMVRRGLFHPSRGNPLHLKDGELLPRIRCKCVRAGLYTLTVSAQESVTVDTILKAAPSISAALNHRYQRYAVVATDTDTAFNAVTFRLDDVQIDRSLTITDVEQLRPSTPTLLKVDTATNIDLTTSGSMLIAGKTRSGKTSGVLALLLQVLLAGPDCYDSKVVIVDPKQAELSRLPRTITLVGGLCVQKYKGGICVQYFKEVVTADGFTISVDMITADYYIGTTGTRNEFELFLRSLPFKYDIDTEFWESHKIGRYRGNYTIKLSDRNSFYIGIALNGLKTEWGKCRVEFNPNKVGCHQILLHILGWLNNHTRPMHRSIRRFDLAIDIPISRLDVRLLKDRRIYSERKYGEEWTEYLGAKSSSIGRCKLYNKTIEAKLNYPLTRLELTLNPEVSYENQPWPSVYYISNQQVQLHELVHLNDTQRFILNALLAGFGNLSDLGRKQRDTIKPYMDNCVKWVSVSTDDYAKIKRQLELYLKNPSSLVNSSNIIPDTRLSPLPF